MSDVVWGPQLIGNLAPWQRVELTARLMARADDDNTEGFVRFVDVEGRSWISAARGALTPDNEGVGSWIEQSRKFAQRGLTSAERGTFVGADAPPDLEAWRE